MDTRTGRLIPADEVRRLLAADASLTRFIRPAPQATPHQVRRGRVRRNEPCPCGSSRKFKRCCGTRRA